MTLQIDSDLDEIDWQLIQLLEEDARLSYRDLGKRVNLTAPAVSNRIARLEEDGIIRGYRAEIDLSKVGLPLSAITLISVARGKSADVAKQLQAMPEVAECHRISGEYSYMLKVHVSSVSHLEQFIDKVGKVGHSSTSIVLSASEKKQIAKMVRF